MQRSVVILVLGALLAACTTGASDPAPEQTPSTPPVASPTDRGDPVGRVAVVLDPLLQARAETVRTDLSQLDPELAGTQTVRVEVADDPTFVRDLAEFFATEGYGLVCVLGPGAGDVVEELAPRSPGTRFCAVPVASDADAFPDNVLAVDVRVEEVAYLAGVALGTDRDTGRVAALTRTSPRGWSTRVRTGLRAGLQSAGRPPGDLVIVPFGDDAEGVDDRVRSLLGRGVGGLLGLVHTQAVVEVSADTPVSEPSPGPTSPAEPTTPTPTGPPDHAGLVLGGPLPGDHPLPPEVLAVVEVHLHEAVVVALRRHVDDWDPSPVSLGVADDTIVAVPNEQARSRGVAAALSDAMAAVRAGETGLEPAETETPAAP